MMDANVILFSPPDTFFLLESYRSSGVQFFQDYLQSFRTVDPWLVHSYVADGSFFSLGVSYSGGADPTGWYASVSCGAEIDSSVVVLNKRRGWRLLHVVCALNWYRHIVYRHMWGDKDTWALAAVFLASTDQASTWKISMADPMAHCAAIPETTTMSRAKSTRPSSAFQVHHSNGDSTKSQGAGAAMLYGSVGGSHVGWFLNHDDTPPSALWGHVQFSRAGGSSDGPDLQGATGASSRDSGVPFVDKSVGEGSTLHGPHGHRLRPRPIDEHPSRLLYLNWQPHYMQGYFNLGPSSFPAAAGASLDCCVFLDDYKEGPHDSPTLGPLHAFPEYTFTVHATLNDTRRALASLGMKLPPPQWLRQPKFRRCVIYWALLTWASVVLLAHTLRLFYELPRAAHKSSRHSTISTARTGGGRTHAHLFLPVDGGDLERSPLFPLSAQPMKSCRSFEGY
mmetsp:Transcript_26480/g.74173  ORF Transcript_26480/g.74173 Transcript_26480/m.74173 type:complete len:451 (-) Transcript_26480:134-1486(-)